MTPTPPPLWQDNSQALFMARQAFPSVGEIKSLGASVSRTRLEL